MSAGRIFSCYLRPWVLHTQDASAHVPLLKDIDITISDQLVAFEAAKNKESDIIEKKRRLRKKQPAPDAYSEKSRYVYTNTKGELLQRSYAEAWKDYRCHHVVSKWASRIIQQFNASHLADSLEAAENDEIRDNQRERSPIDNSWMQLETVQDILQGTASAERRRAGNDDRTTISAHAHLVEEAKTISEKLWSLPARINMPADISKNPASTSSSAATCVLVSSSLTFLL